MTSVTLTHFGQRLRSLRINRGFTSQADFAAAVGVSKKTVTRHEGMERAPRATDKTLQGYLRVLKVGEPYLCYGEGKKPGSYRAVGPRVPPTVEQYVYAMDCDDPAQARVAKRLLAINWEALGAKNPTMSDIRAMHTALETLART